MSWRNRFDPSRVRFDQLRERAARVRNVRALGQQVAAIRRVRPRGELLVPLAAFVILAGTLVLSALSSNSSELSSATPSQVALGSTTTSLDPTPTLTSSASGYPFASTTPTSAFLEPTPAFSDTPIVTESDILTDTTTAGGVDGSGYPGIDGGPVPVDPPPSAEFPTYPTPDNSAAGGSDPQLPPPAPIPTPEFVPSGPLPPSNSGGYPAPGDSGSVPVDPTLPPDNSVPVPTSEPDQFEPTTEVEPGDPTSDVPIPTADGTSETPEAGTTTTPTVPPRTATPVATPVPPTPTARPADVLSGNIRWTTADSPKVISKDTALAAGSTLTIAPGVEVQFAPTVQFLVAGTLRAEGTASAPVRMIGQGGRWDGLVGTAGSTIVVDHAQIRQAGRAGTAISSVGGTLVVRNVLLTDGGGGIVALGSALDLRNTQITGNAIGGTVVNVKLPRQGATTIVGNIVGGNNSPAGAAQLLLTAEGAAAPFAVEGNYFEGGNGTGVVINAGVPVQGTIRCNTFNRGSVGLQLNSNLPDTSGFNVAIDNNAFGGQTNYGATGTLAFGVINNWWGDPSGPTDARRNPQGRGVPIGVNLLFQPWLDARPSCAPAQ